MKSAIFFCSLILAATAVAKDASKSNNKARKPGSVSLGSDKKDLGEFLSEALANYVKASGQYAGLGQGWAEYYMAIRCSVPEGTGNPADKPTCAFVDIK